MFFRVNKKWPRIAEPFRAVVAREHGDIFIVMILVVIFLTWFYFENFRYYLCNLLACIHYVPSHFAFSAKTGTSFNHLTFFGKTGTFFGRWWVICTWLIACVHVLHTIVLFFRHLCWLNGSIHVIYTFKILLKLELRIKKIMSPKFWETILNKNTVNFYFLNVTRHQKIWYVGT